MLKAIDGGKVYFDKDDCPSQRYFYNADVSMTDTELLLSAIKSSKSMAALSMLVSGEKFTQGTHILFMVKK